MNWFQPRSGGVQRQHTRENAYPMLCVGLIERIGVWWMTVNTLQANCMFCSSHGSLHSSTPLCSLGEHLGETGPKRLITLSGRFAPSLATEERTVRPCLFSMAHGLATLDATTGRLYVGRRGLADLFWELSAILKGQGTLAAVRPLSVDWICRRPQGALLSFDMCIAVLMCTILGMWILGLP
ncbi:hypothetical protein BJ322DRAFT_291853 [Thelephora terrestris]|uniref:Uncharacterized protein n=1 Tax=Thelephora terrestris TaxID=56493 RepID=A0A9P6H6W9_9AGAM|nr:hypothetical protein BJ322DRAFT_291853 [Thelephora terrestris]